VCAKFVGTFVGIRRIPTFGYQKMAVADRHAPPSKQRRNKEKAIECLTKDRQTRVTAAKEKNGGRVMQRSFVLAAILAPCMAGPAGAFEYPLLFRPNPGARGLVVAGYSFNGNKVLGNCSYYIISGGGSGRGGGYHAHTTYYNQVCSWNLFGNLLSVAPGASAAPPPISTTGGLTIYARNSAGDTTGIDFSRRNMGFVNTPSSQYAWATQGGGYVFRPNQNPIDVTLALKSVGDLPLAIEKIEPVARLAKVTLKSTSCAPAAVTPGKSCTIVVTYDPHGLPAADDPYTAYDTLTVSLVSNAGQAPDFSETIEVPVSPGG
jgi:hypothetical protein